MAASIAFDLRNSFFMSIVSLFRRKEAVSHEVNSAEIVTREIDLLWSIVREKNEGNLDLSEYECGRKISETYARLRAQFSDEQLDAVYAWPRFVKIASHCCHEPINGLVEYVTERNYIPLTKKLSDIADSVHRSDDNDAVANIDRFIEAVCKHILESVNPSDVPAFLLLGRVAQRRRDYDKARYWFEKITETDEPFNGLTALLASYEEETKSILSNIGKNHSKNSKIKERVRNLNNSQCSVYEKWYRIMKNHINNDEEVTEQEKKHYVALLTGYARFERNRGDYDKAFELLKRVPNTYPEAYRVYTEEAMLYQFRPNKNRYYSLEKAIESFKKAYHSFSESTSTGTVNVKSRKCILMPLANAYFQSGRYEEADDVCDSILEIDNTEQKAINLKNRIACLAS